MSFVSVLKSVGSRFVLGLERALEIEQKALPAEKAIVAAVASVVPAVAAALPTIDKLFEEVATVEQVATAVNAASGTGAGKLAAAAPGVEQLLMQIPYFKGKIPADFTLYNSALKQITAGFADLGNSFATDTPIVTQPVPAIKSPTLSPSLAPANTL